MVDTEPCISCEVGTADKIKEWSHPDNDQTQWSRYTEYKCRECECVFRFWEKLTSYPEVVDIGDESQSTIRDICDTCHWNQHNPDYDAAGCGLCTIEPNCGTTTNDPMAHDNWTPLHPENWSDEDE